MLALRGVSNHHWTEIELNDVQNSRLSISSWIYVLHQHRGNNSVVTWLLISVKIIIMWR